MIPGLAQGGSVYCLGGVRHKDGVNRIQAFAWNLGICRADAKGETQVEDPRELECRCGDRGGPTRSSWEVP